MTEGCPAKPADVATRESPPGLIRLPSAGSPFRLAASRDPPSPPSAGQDLQRPESRAAASHAAFGLAVSPPRDHFVGENRKKPSGHRTRLLGDSGTSGGVRLRQPSRPNI